MQFGLTFSKIAAFAFLVFVLLPSGVSAQEIHRDIQGVWRAKVIKVLSEKTEVIPGTETTAQVQEITIRLLEGEREGETLTITNDRTPLEAGDTFFLNYLVTINGEEIYSVREPDRRGPLVFITILFIGAVVLFGRWKGVRALISLAGSFALIGFVLLPLLLKGAPPVLTAAGVGITILALVMAVTHGVKRDMFAAFLGTAIAVLLAALLAKWAVAIAGITGFASDESVYLNFGTAGSLDLSGIFLASVIIGMLGVLDDVAITQASVVRELRESDPTRSFKELGKRAMRVGQDHVGALINTLALAYVGAALPLLLLFSLSESSAFLILNREIFAVEIIRTAIGGIALVLAVPLTTWLAVWFLSRDKSEKNTD